MDAAIATASNTRAKADLRKAVDDCAKEMRAIGKALEAAAGEMQVHVVDTELDGWQLAKSEVQVVLYEYVLDRSGEPAPSAGQAAEDLAITLRRQRCSATQDSPSIAAGSSDTTIYVVSDETSGFASVSALGLGYPATESARIQLRFPWRSLLAAMVGLMMGIWLKPHVLPREKKKRASRSSKVIDALAGLALLAAFFGGYLAVIAPHLEFLDLRNGIMSKVFGSFVCGVVGLLSLIHI